MRALVHCCLLLMPSLLFDCGRNPLVLDQDATVLSEEKKEEISRAVSGHVSGRGLPRGLVNTGSPQGCVILAFLESHRLVLPVTFEGKLPRDEVFSSLADA